MEFIELVSNLKDIDAGKASLFIAFGLIWQMMRLMSQQNNTMNALAASVSGLTTAVNSINTTDKEQTAAIKNMGEKMRLATRFHHRKAAQWVREIKARIEQRTAATKALGSQVTELHRIARGLNSSLETNTEAVTTLNGRLDAILQAQAELDALVKRLCPDDDEPKTETPAPLGQPPRAKQEPIVLRPEPNEDEEKDVAV